MFKIKKLFKLLGLSLSVSTLLSFLTPSTFASEKNNAIREVTRSILHELIMSDPEQT